MSISDSNPDLSSDNWRALKRYLQGRGINMRRTIVESEAVYAADKIPLPGFRAGDPIISILNWTDGNDVSGLLDLTSYEPDGSGGFLQVFSGNKGLIITSTFHGEILESGAPKMSVKAAASGTYAAGVLTPVASQPLSVRIGLRETLLNTTGPPDEILVLVNLATDASGSALTTSVNSAANVKLAIEAIQYHYNHFGAPQGLVLPYWLPDWSIVTVALVGDGSTHWTAQTTTPLAGGTPDSPRFSPDAVAASLLAEMEDPYLVANVIYTARTPGTDGNSITVEYVAGLALAVAVVGNAITVTFIPSPDGFEVATTAKAVIAAVNAHPAASALVIANPQQGPVPYSYVADGQIATMAQTPLAGGQDAGIRLSEASAGVKLLVDWCTRYDEAEDE